MSQDTERKPRKPLLLNLAWCAAQLMAPLVYVLSYAPVYRWKYGPTPPPPPLRPSSGHAFFSFVSIPDLGRYHELPVYRPVDLLIDHTPLREPLFWWAGLFEVREDFGEGYGFRSDWRLMGDQILRNAGVPP